MSVCQTRFFSRADKKPGLLLRPLGTLRLDEMRMAGELDEVRPDFRLHVYLTKQSEKSNLHFKHCPKEWIGLPVS